jgi:flagellar motility protein MotE (MotC chaperone)
MSKAIEIAAMTLGGLSLFAVCFLGFAVLSGTPLHQVAGIGRLLGAPTPLTPEFPEQPENTDEHPGPRPEGDVISSSIGVMGTWTLPSPYTQDELRGLTDEIKGKLTVLELREQQLDDRELQLDDEADSIAERFEAMERLRADLETFQRELELRELEVMRDEETTRDQNAAQWRDVAVILADLDEEEAGKRLVEYPPEQAAAILRAMTPADASTALNAIEHGRWKEYVDAYTALGGGE